MYQPTKIVISIPEPHPDNKALYSFCKIHIVHDHEHIQSEKTDHNKDKPFLETLYQYPFFLIGGMSKLPNSKLNISKKLSKLSP